MPVTPFQREVMRVIAGNRSPESHVAGGLVINRHAKSYRTSEDMDIFHDSDRAVESSFLKDRVTLEAAGYAVAVSLELPLFKQAVITGANGRVRLEWTRDSACRFFPVVADEDFGWRLSDPDVAVNKILALAGRSEGRDISDAVWLDDNGFPLAMLTWAAPGKDAGMTPEFVMEEMAANAKSPPAEELAAAGSPFTPQSLKKRWSEIARRARAEIREATAAGLIPGLFYYDDKGPAWGERLFAAPEKFSTLAPTVGGAWPAILPPPREQT